MKFFNPRFLFAALILALGLGAGAPAAAADAVTSAIRTGGVILLIRHASAPGVGDPEQFRVDDCTTQRNLSAEGREEAKRIGAHLQALGLQPGAVYSSQWCRCRDTAALAFGWTNKKVTDWPALNSFMRNRDSKTAQMDEVRARIATLKRSEPPLVLVTHQLIITSLTGIFPESGEVVVVAPDSRADKAGKPGLRVLGTIKPAAAK